MPPQQGQNLLDFGDGLFDFRTHYKQSFFGGLLNAAALGRQPPEIPVY